MSESTLMLKTFYWLLVKDLRNVFHGFIDTVIDAVTIPLGWIFIAAYVMPSMGVPNTFGLLFVASNVASMVQLNMFLRAGEILGDIHGNRAINNEILLPIPSWLLVFRYVLSFAIRAGIVNLAIIPFGLVVVFGQVDWSKFSFMFLSIAYVLSMLAIGAMVSAILFWSKSIPSYYRFWARVGWHSVNFGGFFYTWLSLYKVLPYLAFAVLLNPMMHVTESLRVSMMGQEGFLPLWLTLGALVTFTVVFTWLAVIGFKRRLDCY